MLSGLTASFGPGRTGLIGANGSGKSTLLRLIAGQLPPSRGVVRARGEVGYLPQSITLGTHRTVSDLLGVTAARTALHAIEAGATSEELYVTVGDDWDVEERARAWLDRLGPDNLAHLGLDDRVERLSGGETIMVALAALFLRRPDVMLLDEPTNNLDLDARKRLYDAVASWTGVMVIVSHDRELLGDRQGGQHGDGLLHRDRRGPPRSDPRPVQPEGGGHRLRGCRGEVRHHGDGPRRRHRRRQLRQALRLDVPSRRHHRHLLRDRQGRQQGDRHSHGHRGRHDAAGHLGPQQVR